MEIEDAVEYPGGASSPTAKIAGSTRKVREKTRATVETIAATRGCMTLH